MSFFGWLFGTESCNGMFHYPLFMSRKKKVEILDAMIVALEKSGKKKKCSICKRKFNDKMSRWSKRDFNSSICIVCHQKFYNMKCKDYMPYEQKELREMKKCSKQGDKGDTK